MCWGMRGWGDEAADLAALAGLDSGHPKALRPLIIALRDSGLW